MWFLSRAGVQSYLLQELAIHLNLEKTSLQCIAVDIWWDRLPGEKEGSLPMYSKQRQAREGTYVRVCVARVCAYVCAYFCVCVCRFMAKEDGSQRIVQSLYIHTCMVTNSRAPKIPTPSASIVNPSPSSHPGTLNQTIKGLCAGNIVGSVRHLLTRTPPTVERTMYRDICLLVCALQGPQFDPGGREWGVAYRCM